MPSGHVSGEEGFLDKALDRDPNIWTDVLD